MLTVFYVHKKRGNSTLGKQIHLVKIGTAEFYFSVLY